MTRRKNCDPAGDVCLKALVDSQAAVITIVGKTWDMHVTEVLGTTLDENLRMIADSVRFCRAQPHVEEVLYDAEHFFDGFKANPDYALQTLEGGPGRRGRGADPVRHQRRHPARGDCRARWQGRSRRCPASSSASIATTTATWPSPTRWPASYQGATQVQGTINGIGERCGNVDLISVIANLALKRGYEVLEPGSLRRLTELSRYVYEIANMNFRRGQPFVGTSAFAHKGGMHAHGVARVLGQLRAHRPGPGRQRTPDPDQRTVGAIEHPAKTAKYAIDNNKELNVKLRNMVQDLENQGYEFEAAEASFDILVKKALGIYRPKFERLAYRVNVETRRRRPRR